MYSTCVLKYPCYHPCKGRHSCLSQACCLHSPEQNAVLRDDRALMSASIIAPPDWEHVDNGNEKKKKHTHSPANHKRNLNGNPSLKLLWRNPQNASLTVHLLPDMHFSAHLIQPQAAWPIITPGDDAIYWPYMVIVMVFMCPGQRKQKLCDFRLTHIYRFHPCSHCCLLSCLYHLCLLLCSVLHVEDVLNCCNVLFVLCCLATKRISSYGTITVQTELDVCKYVAAISRLIIQSAIHLFNNTFGKNYHWSN